MNIKAEGKPRVIISNPEGTHNYFGWPTVCRTKNGRLAVTCSGYRIAHVCPFGKAIISFSDDEGKTFTKPSPVIDTVLDDRDGGLCAFGKSGLILTSFNNTVEFQRSACSRAQECFDYLDTVDPEEEKKALGAEFRISGDNGETWGNILHSPITSPHGPLELKNGKILWAGTVFSVGAKAEPGVDLIQIWEIGKNGEMTRIGSVKNIFEGEKLLYSCEPHMAELEDGTLICHIRLEREGYFSTWQTESRDEGKTWSDPHPLLGKRGGAPAHLLLHSSGVLISAYGYREKPYGIRIMLSSDGGKTWQTDKVLCDGFPDDDLGYPATVELCDGSLLTVFYAHEKSEDEPAVIFAQNWRLEP